MTPRVQRAIDIFLDAINNGTLAKGSCVACAVGNLVAAGMNGIITVTPSKTNFKCNVPNDKWGQYFCTTTSEQTIRPSFKYVSNVIACIKATEFTEKELMIIENTFEKNTSICSTTYDIYSKEIIRKDQINGLRAVVKAMMEFDDIEEDVEEVFVKRAETIPLPA